MAIVTKAVQLKRVQKKLKNIRNGKFKVTKEEQIELEDREIVLEYDIPKGANDE